MIIAHLFLALVAPQVDLPLKPTTQPAAINDIVEVDLVAHAGAFQEFSAVDALISWDPARLEFLGILPGNFAWLVSGFLGDPDGINDDTTDGEALFTALSPPTPPASVPPDITVVTLRFRVHGAGQVSLLTSSGAFGVTRVVGVTAGSIITGDISGTAQIVLCSPVPALPSAGIGVLVVALGLLGFFVLRRSPRAPPPLAVA